MVEDTTGGRLGIAAGRCARPALGEAGVAPTRIQAFLDELLTQGMPMEVEILDAGDQGQDEYDRTTIFYTLAEYLHVFTQNDKDGFAYALSILHADRLDGVEADALYAQFLSACVGGEPGYGHRSDHLAARKHSPHQLLRC